MVLRHGSTGATAIKNSSSSPTGMVMRSKNGVPTLIRSPLSASTISGNTVPSSTTRANTPNSRLLARNEASRDSAESICPGERSRSPRQAMSPTTATTTRAKNTNRAGPTASAEKAWTESTSPERVRNVPRMVRANVAHTSDRFHTRSIPRRSCTITECR